MAVVQYLVQVWHLNVYQYHTALKRFFYHIWVNEWLFMYVVFLGTKIPVAAVDVINLILKNLDNPQRDIERN